ncbi:MAG: PD40 domain-containing protein [Planctomycetes bacterium]|nr:PD40 domain-containing protein [Planctomycetota bacterium]
MKHVAGLILLTALTAGCGREDEPANTLPAQARPMHPALGPALEPGMDPRQKSRTFDPEARIAFVRHERALWTIRPDGTDARELVAGADSSWLGHPAWSPNRAWIAFSSSAKADRNLYLKNVFIARPNGSDLKQVTPMPRSGEVFDSGPVARARGYAVALLPKGKLGMEGFTIAAYGSDRTEKTGKGGRFEISIPATTAWIKISGTYGGVRYSGSTMHALKMNEVVDLGEILLTVGGAEDQALHPVWAPGGRHLYFTLASWAATSDPRLTVRRIAIDGTNLEPFYHDPQRPPEGGPHVDLEKERLLLRFRGGRASWFDLSTRRAVENADLGFAVPAVSALGPAGSLAFVRLDERLAQTLTLRRSGGSDQAVLALAPHEGSIRALDFAPDGESIVVEIATPEGRRDLHVVSVASGAKRPLTNDGASGDPAWYGR